MTPMTLPRAIAIATVALLVGVGIDLLVGLPTGRAVLLGLGGCVGIIVVSKWLGKVWLQRPEDYYERERALRGGESGPAVHDAEAEHG